MFQVSGDCNPPPPKSPFAVAVVYSRLEFHCQSNDLFDKINCIRTQSKNNYTNPFSSSFLPKQWPLCGPCQLQNRSGREWSGGATAFSAFLPEWWCPFSLQLHFHFKQLIVVAVPRGPVAETFKAVPFCSFYGPQTMAPLVESLCQLELDNAALWFKSHFFDSIRQCKLKNQSRTGMTPEMEQHVLWLFI